MGMYFLLTAVGLTGFTIAIIGLVWLIQNGQLDDLDTPGMRMLHDDAPIRPIESKEP